jgi:hypothetical protein
MSLSARTAEVRLWQRLNSNGSTLLMRIKSCRLRPAAVAIVWSLGCSLVAAQTSLASPQFAQFLESKFNRDAVQTAVRNQVSKWPGACTVISFDSKFEVAVLQPSQFSADGRSLTAGASIESFAATACGVTRRHNVLNVVKDGAVYRLPRLVGTSIADYQLQSDSALHVIIAAKRLASEGCTSFFANDTQFLAFEAEAIPNARAGRNARAWREDWTIWACGKEVVVPMLFIPDATGTTISVDHSKIRLK